MFVFQRTNVPILFSINVIMLQGAANRKVAATNMNLASSRSHSVFTCIIESKWESQGVTRHLFTRASSERQKSSSAKGERLKEATKFKLLVSGMSCYLILLGGSILSMVMI
ncbi:kinesin-like protein KIN-12E [Camellia sinensis]|uniref:kinesin-like protein KIN-12E n=1 Tax=Camellia sinensis TaxID=4442 RepID=UPI001035BD67|nr:kinesin-like protein KIN-12E [Camellia sinensis]